MLTCPCNEDPLTSHSFIVKLGFTAVYIFCLIFALKHIYCGYSLERLNEAVLTCTHNICFEQKYENTRKISTENCHFYSSEKSLYVALVGFRGARNTWKWKNE